MKKFISLLLLSSTLAFSTPIYAANDITVYVDGSKVAYDAKPMIGGGSTLVPLRQTFEALGADVVWDNASQTITAKKDGTTIKLTIGNDYAYKNDDILKITSSPIVENNRTYVPLRFVAESFGADVGWSGSTQTVTIKTTTTNNPSSSTNNTSTNNSLGLTFTDGYLSYNNKKYEVITVAGDDLSGTRKPNVAVDIGYGDDRVYWGLTNEYGQLTYVLAENITLQDATKEPVNSNGRYFNDEAKVPGVERSDLDEGHVIADSLGGVSNAYNITPQNSTLNRYGDQAYFEKNVRDAGGCSNFVATITYPNTTTQIPSKYHYEYILKGNKVVDDFNNASPETSTSSTTTNNNSTNNNTTTNTTNDISKIDTNGNGQVSIAEAKAAGFTMPIKSTHWLYKYMTDSDGDGLVGE